MSDEPTPTHLEPIWTDRGFRHMPAVQGDRDEEIKVYESSAALSPHIWLWVVEGNSEATAHLTLEQAGKIRDQLDYLIHTHYQLEP